MPDICEEYGGYVTAQALGRGGSATVYLAVRPGPDRSPVALKVLHPEHRDATHVARLAREFEFAARFHHPHIIEVYAHGPHWLAMRYVDGGNINSLGTVTDRMAAMVQIAQALDAVHRQGIVHCDVKPTNILVHQDFSARGAVLIDFGVAHSLAHDMAERLSHDPAQRFSLDPARRITHQRVDQHMQLEASLPYVAPELLLSRMPTGASDQYGLACTAVELLTGSPPFPAGSPAALIDAHLHQPPPRASERGDQLAHAVDAVLARAMAKDPDRRYDSCTEFIGQLSRTVQHGLTC